MTRKTFLPQEPVLVRTPLLPDGTGDLIPEGAGAHPVVEEGIGLATRQADAILAEAIRAPLGRAALTVRGYELRARSRPTPQGVFAGVSIAMIAAGPCERPSFVMGDAHRAFSRPSPTWLYSLAAQILPDAGVWDRLRLSANGLAVLRGSRWEVERPSEEGESGPRRVTVKATAPTKLIMDLCRTGAKYGEALEAVLARWPTVARSVVHGTLSELVRHGFVLHDLLPAQLAADPLAHVLGKLPDDHRFRGDLTELRSLLAHADELTPGDPNRRDLMAAARNIADKIHECDRPWTVDVVADTDLLVPGDLMSRAAEAAGVLWRVSRTVDPVAQYHDRFLDRYGKGRVVPLLDVADPVLGLGSDVGTAAAPETPEATAALIDLLMGAARRGDVEVRLHDAVIAAMAAPADRGAPPRSAEIYVRVFADSRADLAAGRLRLAVGPYGVTQQAGSSLGRFTPILPALAWPNGTAPAIVAELVVQPVSAAAGGLAPETGNAQARIPLGVAARPGDLTVDELGLVSDGKQLLVWSSARRQRFIPVLYSRLSPHLLPPLARLLLALGQHPSRPVHAWDWGPLAHAPFQPRVAYGTTVLSPARWRLPQTIIAPGTSEAEWGQALTEWRAGTIPPVPDVVVLDAADQTLPLDLRRDDDRALLRRHVARGVTALAEQPGGPDAVRAVVHSGTGRHALELVVPLLAADQGNARASHVPASAARASGVGVYPPGSSWLSLTVRSASHWQDDVIGELAAVIDPFGFGWFWLRYHDKEGPHLRLRVRGSAAELGRSVLPAVSGTVGQMVTERLAGGLTITTYEQEIERYGGSPQAMTAAEDVFIADSRLVLAGLVTTTDRAQRIVNAALVAASMIRRVVGGNPAAMNGRHLDRATRRTFDSLRSRARSAATATDARAQRQHLDDALAVYASRLAPSRRVACVSSLIHMHVNRMLGSDPRTEATVRALAADLLHLGGPASFLAE
ncbi:lantibiotic dehydratase [Acrocarpospora sp. B8E8]|uniref:lantibiotic dehydratase n=1 Tax=Acrocarpospora sp. B8E8 TaxID=3153572 RepID=UPI00325D2440